MFFFFIKTNNVHLITYLYSSVSFSCSFLEQKFYIHMYNSLQSNFEIILEQQIQSN